MTPVMERCACSWPVAECIEHSPPRAPVDDQDGLTQPTRAAYVGLVAIRSEPASPSTSWSSWAW
jgi:hypothetical protein